MVPAPSGPPRPSCPLLRLAFSALLPRGDLPVPQGSTPRSGRVPEFTGSRLVLPREGRQAPAPAWPLPGDPSSREAELWELEWARPQAIIWDRDALENDVALYVRKRAEAETPGSSSASVDTMRRLADDLLLTVP